jgi:hypothetical protein
MVQLRSRTAPFNRSFSPFNFGNEDFDCSFSAGISPLPGSDEEISRGRLPPHAVPPVILRIARRTAGGSETVRPVNIVWKYFIPA